MKKEEYTYEKHVFVFCKSAGKSYCVNCGFVALNNPFSIWVNEKGCNNQLHPSYNSTKHKFTKLPGEV